MVPEGMEHLAPPVGGDWFVDAEIGGGLSGGEIGGVEEQVPEREETGEISVDGFGGAGVVPAMEGRGDEDVAERAECPVHVGVDEDGVETEEGW